MNAKSDLDVEGLEARFGLFVIALKPFLNSTCGLS